MGEIVEQGACYLCGGDGAWEDCVAQQTVMCPLCRGSEAKEQARGPILPKWSSYFDRLEARWYGPRFQVAPWLIVMHSGEICDGVAEYFLDPRDGAGKERKVSAHLAWARRQSKLVQCVPFDRVAWHAGGAVLNGNGKLNFCSIGIEMPGPWDKTRGDGEMDSCIRALRWLKEKIPTLKHIVGHSEIDAEKKDPGPGFDWRRVRELFP